MSPGVAFVRGSEDAANFWTVEIGIPVGGTPDPDTPAKALSDRATAETLAAGVRAAGFTPRVEEVTAPATADYDPGTLGWRVRVGHLASKAESDTVLAQIVAAGFTGSSRFTGWDGSSDRPRSMAVAGSDDRPAGVLRATARLVRTGPRGPGDDQRAQPGGRRDRGRQRRLLRPRPARGCAWRPGRRRGVRRPVAQRDDQLPSGAGTAGRRPADACRPAALDRHRARPGRSVCGSTGSTGFRA